MNDHNLLLGAIGELPQPTEDILTDQYIFFRDVRQYFPRLSNFTVESGRKTNNYILTILLPNNTHFF